MENCPCGSGKNYSKCCGVFITGKQHPLTPEALMRSRYTAFTQANIDYIQRTMQSPAADNFDPTDALAWAKQNTWLKLEIVKTSHHDSQGFVEFIAHFKLDNEHHAIHEVSEFRLDNGQWYYVNGRMPENKTPYVNKEKIGRNDPCSCGSGKKYKKCCMGSQELV